MKKSNESIKLTDKQKKFCREYFKDFDRVAAYKRAGYSVESENAVLVGVSKLFKNVKVKKYFTEMGNQSILRALAEAESISADCEVLRSSLLGRCKN